MTQARHQGVLEETLKGDVDTNLDERGNIVTKRIAEKMKLAENRSANLIPFPTRRALAGRLRSYHHWGPTVAGGRHG
jgi:hypothetical protein